MISSDPLKACGKSSFGQAYMKHNNGNGKDDGKIIVSCKLCFNMIHAITRDKMQ